MDIDVLAVAKQLFDAIMQGQWSLAVAVAVVLVVFVLRKFVAPKVPFLASDAGGVLLAFAASLAGGMATAFAAGQGFTWKLLFATAQLAFLAMGGYSALKKLVAPLIAKVAAWVKSKFGVEVQ